MKRAGVIGSRRDGWWLCRRVGRTHYGAKSWSRPRRVAARIEATWQGLDILYVVTNIGGGTAWWLYECLYCARGQAENLIKLHKDPACLC